MARKILILAVFTLAVAVLATGCNGVLYEKKEDNGQVQRLRLDQSQSWSDYDTTPRYRSQKSKDQDDYGVLLKNELTF
jgi:hypothetical protein